VSGALAGIVADALRTASHDIESVEGKPYRPAESSDLADRVTRALNAAGLRADEPVLVRIGNRTSDIGSLLGVWQAGAVAVPAHIGAAPATLASLKGATGARFQIDGDQLQRFGEAVPPERPLLDGAALIIFTSGSTGQPKGVVVGHDRLARKLTVLDRLLSPRADDAVLVPLQMTFIFGLWVALLTLRAGARLILVPKFSGDAIARGLGMGATVLAGVPSMYRSLLASPGFVMPKLRLAMTGGEVLPRPLALALRKVAPNAALYDLFGLTETGTCDFVLGPDAQPDGFGSIGMPTESVEFRIEDGELQVCSPFAMLGYLDNPELTAASINDRYFKTGDLVRLRPDGHVELIGRAKDIVSRGGNKIAPLEIDNLICEHPGVAAALCAGVPDERLGEAIHAVVVPRGGVQMSVEHLRDWLSARTERYKVPDVIRFADALPAGSTGKADRRAVAALTRKPPARDASNEIE